MMKPNNQLPSQSPALKDHPTYQKGMEQLKAGRWQKALASFQLLQGVYPDDLEVKRRLEEIQMRAILVRPQAGVKTKTAKRLSLRRLMIGMAAIIAMAAVGYLLYAIWKESIFRELRLRQITQLRTQADEAIAAGDFAQARQALQELQLLLPEDPETFEALNQVEQVAKLSSLYNEAKGLIADQEWDQAVEVLTKLQKLDKQYRDVPSLLKMAQEAQALNEQYLKAEAAFERGDWESAIAQYEAIQQASLTFRFNDIQTRLFESHLNYGQALLAEAGQVPDQVANAQLHFSEALKFSPVDEAALNKRSLTETYLAALNSEDEDEVIDLLQQIYANQPDYANGAAAQLLYRTLLQRGDAFLKSGNQTLAVADYQAAAQLLVEDPSEAQERLAEHMAKAAP